MTNASNTNLSLGQPASLKDRSGFSLVELMCVIAIVSLIASAALPSVVGIISGDRLSNNAYELGGLMQQARTMAMTQHTYVWMGFYSYTKDGAANVMVSTLAGNSCQPTDLNSHNTQLAAKSIILRNVTLATAANYETSATPLPGVDPNGIDASAATFSYTMSVPGNSSASFTNWIAFGPDGQAFLPASVSDPLTTPVRCAGVGFNAAPGSPSHLHTVAVQVHGLSGQVSVFQQ